MSNKEEKTKIPILSKILNIVGLLFAAIFTFMGLIYVTYGNIWLSAFITIVVIIVLFFLSDRLLTLKIQQKKKQDITPETAIGIIYLIVFLVLLPFHFHFIDLDFNRKDVIKKAGLDKLDKLKVLKTKYEEAITDKKNQLNTLINTNFNNLKTADKNNRKLYADKLLETLGKGVDTEMLMSSPKEDGTAQAIEESKKRKEKTITQTYEQENLHKEYEAYYDKANKTFENWDRMKISYYYSDIDNMYKTMYKSYKDKMPDFAYQEKIQSKDINITNPIDSVQSAGFGKLLIALVVLLILHLCILASYLIVERAEPTDKLTRRTNRNTPIGGIQR